MTQINFETGGPVPYLPSLLWMRTRGEGLEMKTRDYTRTRIWSNTPGGMTLTVPVAGGSSAAKRLPPDRLTISGHGDWTRIHLGALDAAYGKEPYFQHLFPAMAMRIECYPEKLTELNAALLAAMLEFLDYDNEMPGVLALENAHPERFRSIAERLWRGIDPIHSFLEALFRYGRDAIFLLPNE